MSDLTDWITAAGTVVTGASVLIAVVALRREEQARRQERVYSLSEGLSPDFSDEEGALLLKLFPDRWKRPPVPLPEAEGIEMWKHAGTRFEQGDSQKYNVARRHLNRLVPLAIAYLHDTIDRDLFAREFGVLLIRSSLFFGSLIRAAGDDDPSQSWQVIPDAADLLERRYGRECSKLQRPSKAPSRTASPTAEIQSRPARQS